ncbi:MAG: GNAT family N-acetyltransferase [Gemmatimonadota bacterium]|nr:MAG: GNAT family N-acetyltransferase [Gemmatimonadota bacterium]
MPQEYSIRKASHKDLHTIVSFTLQEAREAEAAEKDAGVVRRGVLAGLDDPAVASYWVAESNDGEVVASTSVVREWSNWHAGYYWWVQSLYIVPGHRGRGLVELLLDVLHREAQAAGALDLRLYAHTSNRRAIEAYRRCGFSTAPYTIMTRRLHSD